MTLQHSISHSDSFGMPLCVSVYVYLKNVSDIGTITEIACIQDRSLEEKKYQT